MRAIRDNRIAIAGQIEHGARALIEHVSVEGAFIQAANTTLPDGLFGIRVLLCLKRLIHQLQLLMIGLYTVIAMESIPSEIRRETQKQGRGHDGTHNAADGSDNLHGYSTI